MTHHGDEHVDEYDDDGHVVEGKEEHAHPLHDGRGVTPPRETDRVQVALLFVWVLDLYAVNVDEAEH